MSSATPLGFGLVGTGMIADFHVQAIRDAKGADLRCVAGRSADKVKTFADKHGIPRWTTELTELVRDPAIHVVCITTPSGAHLEPALAAIEAGKHVIVEKPLEITLERVDELLRAAAAAGVTVAPIFQARFGEGARTVKAALEAGRFGRKVLCSAYVKWHRKPEYYVGSWRGTRALDGGGALMNQGIHAVDLLQWFAGVPQEVFGWTTRRVHEGIEVEDTVCASLRFSDGALGVIEASTALYPGWSRRLEICGEHGSAALEDDRITRWDFRETSPGDDAIRMGQGGDKLGSGASAPNAISHQGHLRQIQNLIDALRGGGKLALDGPDARNAVAIIRAVYASAAANAPIKL